MTVSGTIILKWKCFLIKKFPSEAILGNCGQIISSKGRNHSWRSLSGAIIIFIFLHAFFEVRYVGVWPIVNVIYPPLPPHPLRVSYHHSYDYKPHSTDLVWAVLRKFTLSRCASVCVRTRTHNHCTVYSFSLLLKSRNWLAERQHCIAFPSFLLPGGDGAMKYDCTQRRSRPPPPFWSSPQKGTFRSDGQSRRRRRRIMPLCPQTPLQRQDSEARPPNVSPAAEDGQSLRSPRAIRA